MALIGPISGSLTTLSDGNAFLVAGSNITLATGSSGAVTITAAGGSGSPGGSNTQIQYNDGGDFGGDSGLMFIEASNCVFATNIHATNALSASYIVPSTSDNSVQITSGSTEHDIGDVFLYVSGTKHPLNTTMPLSGQKVTLFEGDTYVSGAIVGVSGMPSAVGGHATLNLFGGNNATGRIMSMAGYHAVTNFSSPGGPTGDDIFFSVSGSIGRKGHDGVAAFGGDVVVSGALHIVSSSGHGDSGPANMFVLDDERGAAQIGRAHIGYVGSSDFAAFAHQDKATTTAYCIAHRSTGQTDLNTAAGTNMTFRYASAVRMQMDQNGNFSVGPNYVPGTHKLAISGSALIENDLFVSGGMTVGFAPSDVEDGSEEDFIVNTKNITAAFKVDGANDRVIIGSTDEGQDISIGEDTFFHVSGTTGGKDSGGVAVFGGDMVVSGGLVIGGAPTESADGSTQDFVVNGKDNGALFVIDGDEGQIKIASYGDDGQEEFVGSDCKFHISGTINPLAGDSIDNRYTCLGGDTVISGSLIGAGNWWGDSGANTLSLFGGAEGQGQARLWASVVHISAYAQTTGPSGNDIFLSVSGSTGAKNGSVEGVTVFGGDTVTSGSLYNPGMGGTGSGAAIKIDMTGKLFYDSSDWNLKKNIEPLEDSLEKITQCQGVSFEYRETYGGPRHIGVIAQDIQPLIPEVVVENHNGMLSVDYSKLTAVLIEAVKELNSEVQQLKQKISDLES